jgi:predicted transcriptional regulator YdeE
MKLVEVEEKIIRGLSVRTTNTNEMNPSTGRIGPLWKAFDDQVEVDYKNGNRVYGVYFDYQSDEKEAYSVLAGTDQLDANSSTELQTITIQKGKYLMFAAQGDIPQIIVTTWGSVWDYFSKPDAGYTRLYTTDFEYYVNQNAIELFIAVV